MDNENNSNAPVSADTAPDKAVESSSGSSAAGGNVKKPKKKGSMLIRLVLLAVVVYLCYDIYEKIELANRKPEVPFERIHGVKTELVKKIRGSFSMQYAGTTRAIRQVDIGFNVSGTLNQLPIKAGETIEKGDMIGALDPRDFQNDLNAATANYTNAQARLARVQKLYDAAVDPKSKLDEAIALFKVAEANLEIAQKARDDTVLQAPFKGIVAIRYVDNYQVVDQGQPVISLQDLETLEVQADIPEWMIARATDAAEIKAYATYEALPDVKIPLGIKEYFAQATSSTRTYTVRFFMQENPTNADVTILPGMTADITMEIIPKSGSVPEFLLPVWAVNSIGGNDKPSVFVVDDTQDPWIVKEKKVDVGQMTADSIVVKGTLNDGDRVVIAGATKLQDGMKVKDLPDFLKSNIADINDKKAEDAANKSNDMQMLPEESK